jgi:hypothetical protein
MNQRRNASNIGMQASSPNAYANNADIEQALRKRVGTPNSKFSKKRLEMVDSNGFERA